MKISNIIFNLNAATKFRKVRFFSSIAMLMFLSPGVNAQLFGSLEISSTQELSFGSFYAGSSGGTVTIAPDGVRTTTGSVIPLTNSIGSQAIFEIQSLIPRIVHIVLPESERLSRISGGESMMIKNFTSDKPFNIVVATLRSKTVGVGATLIVKPLNDNPPGNYRGSFSVTFVSE